MNAKAYAKINIGLHIVGKRPDGFHNLETIFHRINLFDDISVVKSDTISVMSTNPTVPSDNTNLCWKAVEYTKEVLGLKNGAAISIAKAIPVGAGLGGGSSDAATVLKMLPELWGVSVEPAVLSQIAVRIGSDVPYFLTDATAYAEGRGEILQPIHLSVPYWIVVVYPNIHISTPWAYSALAERRNRTFPARPKMLDLFSADPNKAIRSATNDFEEIVFDQHFKIKKIKIQLDELGAILSLMSGSGSSMFGFFDDMISALKAVEFFSKEHFVHLTEPNFSPQ